MQTKLSTLKAYAANNDWNKAIAMAAKFSDLGSQRNQILDAHLAITNPRWIAAMHKDPQALISNGIAALRARYSI